MAFNQNPVTRAYELRNSSYSYRKINISTSASCPDEPTGESTAESSLHTGGSRLTLTLFRLRHSGNRKPISLPGLFGPSEADRKDRKNVQSDGLGNQSFSRHASADTDNDSLSSQESLSVRKYSDNCRTVVKFVGEHSKKFLAKLESVIDGRWETVYSYECGFAMSMRSAFHPDGNREVMLLELPDDIVKEMAVIDFDRNWQYYMEAYLREIESNKRACRELTKRYRC